MKQRIGVIFLLSVLTLPAITGYSVFKFKQYGIRKAIKKEIKQGIPEADQVKIKIPKSWETDNHPDFQRIHAGEFRYKGQMYDILWYENQGDTTLYGCVWDTKESVLFSQLDDLTARKMGSSESSGQNRLVNVCFYFSLFFDATEKQNDIWLCNKQDYNPEKISHLTKGNFTPEYPPPEA